MDEDLRARYRVNRGDYNAPVHRAPRPPVHHQPARPHNHTTTAPRPEIESAHPVVPHQKGPKRKLFRKVIIVLVILGILGGAAAWAYPKYMDKNPFPANIQSSAQVQLFYPSKMPAGFKIEPSSMHFTNGAFIYDAKNADKRLVFTLQKTPPTYNYSSFYGQDLKNLKELTSPYGKAVVGKYQDRYLGSLVSGNTWLLLSTNNTSVSADDMSLIISNLKKY